MISPVNGSTEKYLDDLNRIQSSLNGIQRQLSSGVRVGQPSDDPSAIAGIMDTLARIAGYGQSQTNLGEVKTELDAGDAALQYAVKAVEQAISLGTQAAGTLDATARATLAQQVQAVQEQLVGLSRTSASGRYIFSGDLDQQPLYVLDASQPGGVRTLATATSTRAVTDGSGNTIWTPPTAQEIFDPRNADGSPASGNVFVAVNSLLASLQSGDTAAAAAAVDSLKAADDHLNQQLGLYGIAETRVADSLNSVETSLAREKQNLGTQRDADIAAAAIQLNQVTLQQQAALASGAKLSKMSLFDYLA